MILRIWPINSTLDSDLADSNDFFSSLRVKPKDDLKRKSNQLPCDHPQCDKVGVHKAPKGGAEANQYYNFCLAHVREYNKGFNFFKEMKDAEVKAYIAESRTGHRPTWKRGTGGAAMNAAQEANLDNGLNGRSRLKDPFEFFGGDVPIGASGRPRKQLRNAERKALAKLGLDESSKPEEIKKQFKMLAKRHHPDLNRGDKASEAILSEIISAYNHLKSVDYV